MQIVFGIIKQTNKHDLELYRSAYPLNIMLSNVFIIFRNPARFVAIRHFQAYFELNSLVNRALIRHETISLCAQFFFHTTNTCITFYIFI